MSSKPKAPKPTAQELELQRSQRRELDTLTRDRNATLKALKRNLGGRRGLLGSGSERGVRSDAAGGRGGAGGGAGGIVGGGIMGRGAPGRVGTPRTPPRGSAL